MVITLVLGRKLVCFLQSRAKIQTLMFCNIHICIQGTFSPKQTAEGSKDMLESTGGTLKGPASDTVASCQFLAGNKSGVCYLHVNIADH